MSPSIQVPAHELKSVTNITDVPCARNSLLGGIASGAGIGVVRGMSAGVLLCIQKQKIG
jgi:Protein of unknown function (DUF3767)